MWLTTALFVSAILLVDLFVRVAEPTVPKAPEERSGFSGEEGASGERKDG